MKADKCVNGCGRDAMEPKGNFAPIHCATCGKAYAADARAKLAISDRLHLEDSAANCVHKTLDRRGNCTACGAFVTAMPHLHLVRRSDDS